MEYEKGDVYLASTSTQMERESWLINSGASFHMKPHGHWFSEFEELKSGDVDVHIYLNIRLHNSYTVK